MINEQTIRKACNDLANLLIKKNHDYGNSVQEQYNEYGMNSILIRLDDKQRRLKNLRSKEGQVTSESTEDTLQDLAGYALLGLLCLEDETLPALPIEHDLNYNPINSCLNFNHNIKTTVNNIPEHVKNYGKHNKSYTLKDHIHAYFDTDDQH